MSDNVFFDIPIVVSESIRPGMVFLVNNRLYQYKPEDAPRLMNKLWTVIRFEDDPVVDGKKKLNKKD